MEKATQHHELSSTKVPQSAIRLGALVRFASREGSVDQLTIEELEQIVDTLNETPYDDKLSQRYRDLLRSAITARRADTVESDWEYHTKDNPSLFH